MAFDLYPLLRSEEWLDRAEGHAIYRETRAQELTEILWSHPTSPWYDKINMLGERQSPWVSQSAWIKSLMASFIRSWDGRAGSAGGLFGGRSNLEEVLGWSRAQQAAFLIFIWNSLRSAVAKSTAEWAVRLRGPPVGTTQRASRAKAIGLEGRPGLLWTYSLINTETRVCGAISHVAVNDVSYWRASTLKLNKWVLDERSLSNPVEAVDVALRTLERQDFITFVAKVAKSLASFDWRTSSAPEMNDSARRAKLVFRGSSGYKELRAQLLEHLAKGEGDIADFAKRIASGS